MSYCVEVSLWYMYKAMNLLNIKDVVSGKNVAV